MHDLTSVLMSLVQDPETIVLGTHRKMKGSGEKRCVEVNDELKYIPLLSTLERLLQSKKVLQQVGFGVYFE